MTCVTLPMLEAARAGDQQAFRELTEPYLRELHVHCYRMLGSVDDADDLVQETLVAAWRGLASFAGRSSLRAWLYRIATNRCLNAIRDGKRRPPPAPVPPFDPPAASRTTDVPWLQPYPTAGDPSELTGSRETIELAFVAALQTLPPRQTAALLLGDVLGFSVPEISGMLDARPTAVKGLLQRARATMARGPKPSSYDAGLARRFADAFSRDDIDGVVALLTDDAWLAMPPALEEYHGRAAIARFLRASAGWRSGGQLRLVPTEANGQPAFGCYLSSGSVEQAAGILVLTLGPDGITAITRFLDPALHTRFGLSPGR